MNPKKTKDSWLYMYREIIQIEPNFISPESLQNIAYNLGLKKRNIGLCTQNCLKKTKQKNMMFKLSMPIP